MSNEERKKDYWVQYITKLNDRDLSKRQSSGITTWALFSILGYLLYTIIDRVPILFSNPEVTLLFLLTFVTLVNTISMLFIIIVVITSNTSVTPEIRLRTKLFSHSYGVQILILYFLYFVISAMNILIACLLLPYSIEKWPYIVVGVFLFIQVAVLIGYDISGRLKLKKHCRNIDMPLTEMRPAIQKNFNQNKKRGLIFIIVILAISIYALIVFFSNTPISSNLDIIKLSLEVTAFIILFTMLIGELVRSNRRAYLERLEQNIILNNMSSDEIRDKYIREFLGETIADFIDGLEHQIKAVRDNYLSSICKLKSINFTETPSEEETKSRNEQLKGLDHCLDEYAKLLKTQEAKLTYLIEDAAFSDNPELLKHIHLVWKSNFEDIKKAFDEFKASLPPSFRMSSEDLEKNTKADSC